MLLLVTSFIIGIAQSVSFKASSLSSDGLSYTIDVGVNKTSVTVTTPRNKWSGIGFGSLEMKRTVAVIFTGTLNGMTQYKLGEHQKGTDLGTNYWTIDSITVNTTNKLTYTMSRSNNISSKCADCYVFDPTDTSLQVIYALGSSTTYAKHQYKQAQTLSTPQPTVSPVSVPTTSPVEPEDLTYENCVGGHQVIGDVSLSLGRNTASGYMEIEIEGPDARWFGFGFGSTSMSGTYAIISIDQDTTQEWRLGQHSSGFKIGGKSWVFSEVKVDNGVRTVKLIRPYSTSDTYDFTKFMEATTTNLKLISALGMDKIFTNGHMTKGSNSVTTLCQVDDGKTPAPITIPDNPGNGSNSGNIHNYLFGIFISIIVILY